MGRWWVHCQKLFTRSGSAYFVTLQMPVTERLDHRLPVRFGMFENKRIVMRPGILTQPMSASVFSSIHSTAAMTLRTTCTEVGRVFQCR